MQDVPLSRYVIFCGCGGAPDGVVGSVGHHAVVELQRELGAQHLAGVSDPATHSSHLTFLLPDLTAWQAVFCTGRTLADNKSAHRELNGCVWNHSTHVALAGLLHFSTGQMALLVAHW